MKKYIFLAIIFFGVYRIVQAYEIGEFVYTNKEYQRCFGGNECGHIVAINRPAGNPTDVLTLDTGEDISTFWIDKTWHCKQRKCDCYQEKSKRLTVNEMIGSETFHTVIYKETNYHCVRCGKSLWTNPVGWYCKQCKTGFNIKEE